LQRQEARLQHLVQTKIQLKAEVQQRFTQQVQLITPVSQQQQYIILAPLLHITLVEQLRFQRLEVQQLLSIPVNQQLQHIQRVLLQQEQLLLVQVEIPLQRLTQ
tara:strand:- start:96 stop:407 length:312 start_codon:yes stop_codon:yes gene_type:complete